MHPPILPSFFQHWYKSSAPPECLHSFLLASFSTSCPSSLLYPPSRKQEVRRTVTNPSSCSAIVNLCVRMWVNKKKKKSVSEFMCNKLQQPLSSCHVNWVIQDPMTCMSVVKLVQAIWYCFDSMPEYIQPISLEQRKGSVEPYSQIISEDLCFIRLDRVSSDLKDRQPGAELGVLRYNVGTTLAAHIQGALNYHKKQDNHKKGKF